MNCPACSSAVPDEAAFCHQCGARLDGQKSAASNPNTAFNPNTASDLRERLSSVSSREDSIENILWSGGYSPKAMIGSWIGASFATIGLLVLLVFLSATGVAIPILLAIIVLLWTVLGILLVYRKLNHHYELTNQRFVHSTGILRRVTDRIEAIDMDDVAYEQGIIERIVNVGKIRIASSDCSHPELTLNGIDDVKKIAKLIDDARHKERLRRGLHIEAI